VSCSTQQANKHNPVVIQEAVEPCERGSTAHHELAEQAFQKGRTSHPPTGTPRRAMSPGEGPQISPLRAQGEQPDCPSLRASDEHSSIVRVLRARRTVWLLPLLISSETARCAGTGDSPSHPSPAGGLFQQPARTLRPGSPLCPYTFHNSNRYNAAA